MLGTMPHGKWLNDGEAPSSSHWRRFISMDKATGDFKRARILNQGIESAERHDDAVTQTPVIGIHNITTGYYME